MSHSPRVGQLLLPRRSKLGSSRHQHPFYHFSSVLPTRGKGGTSAALAGEDSSVGRNLPALDLLHTRARSKSQEQPARAQGRERGARLVPDTALGPSGEKTDQPETDFPGSWAAPQLFWELKAKAKRGGCCWRDSSPAGPRSGGAQCRGLLRPSPGLRGHLGQFNQQGANGPPRPAPQGWRRAQGGTAGWGGIFWSLCRGVAAPWGRCCLRRVSLADLAGAGSAPPAPLTPRCFGTVERDVFINKGKWNSSGESRLQARATVPNGKIYPRSFRIDN